ncbi:MAG TPA: DUF5668 domain-containing protein [Candidatus Dormibacteraeota bacterium]
MNRYPGVAFPVLLIGAGLLALLANLGVVHWSQLARLLDLWPLLLIVIGVELMLRRTFAAPVATGVVAAVAIGAVLAGVAYVAAGPGIQVGEHAGSASAPLAGAEGGRLTLTGGGVRFTAQLGDIEDDLFRATYTNAQGEDPAFGTAAGDVSIRYGGGHRLFGSAGPRSLDMTLNRGLPWTLELNGGGFSADLDLHDGSLKGISISGGGIDLKARLPAPHGTVPITISGGGVSVDLHRPAGAEARVRVNGGGSDIDADGSHRSALAGESEWSSPGYAGAADRYDVTVTGGGTHVSIDSSG